MQRQCFHFANLTGNILIAAGLACLAFQLAHCVSPSARVSFLDILFKRQEQWIQDENPINALQAMAKQAGLSESDFVVCLKDQKRLDGIRDIQSRAAEELGVRSTPTFFVNGDKLEGNQPLAASSKMRRRFWPILRECSK